VLRGPVFDHRRAIAGPLVSFKRLKNLSYPITASAKFFLAIFNCNNFTYNSQLHVTLLRDRGGGLNLFCWVVFNRI